MNANDTNVESAPENADSVDASSSPDSVSSAEGVTDETTQRLSQELAQTKTELEAARRRVDELARAYQALDRDREEFKQRLSRERDRMLDVERGKVALLAIEAIDELDRSLALAKGTNDSLVQGVRLIRDGLLKKVESTGIERLTLVGQMYDPNVAEAADMEITAESSDDQKIVAELQAGYRLKDRVIRPARVKVAKYVQPAQA